MNRYVSDAPEDVVVVEADIYPHVDGDLRIVQISLILENIKNMVTLENSEIPWSACSSLGKPSICIDLEKKESS